MTVLIEMLPALIFIFGLTLFSIAATLARPWFAELKVVLKQFFRKKMDGKHGA